MLEFPEVVLSPGGSLEQAAESVVGALSAERSFDLVETLATPAGDGPGCRILRAEYRGTDCVFVVTTGPWDEEQILEVLNVLLGLRSDPDRPGRAPRFSFYSAEPVPAVLETMFGPSAVSDFEASAALVVQFGHALAPETALQIAAVGMFLLADVFSLRTSFYAGDGETALATELARRLRSSEYPDDGAPINTLLSLGVFYGERLRERIPYASRWVVVEKAGQWPVLAFESAAADTESAAARSGEAEPAGGGDPPASGPQGESAMRVGRDGKSLVMSPVGVVVGAFQSGNWEVLSEAATELEDRCRIQLSGTGEGQR